MKYALLINRFLAWWDFQSDSLPLSLCGINQSKLVEKADGVCGWTAKDREAVADGGVSAFIRSAGVGNLTVGNLAIRKVGVVQGDSGFVEFNPREVSHIVFPRSIRYRQLRKTAVVS
jgi:hypothetical protein